MKGDDWTAYITYLSASSAINPYVKLWCVSSSLLRGNMAPWVKLRVMISCGLLLPFRCDHRDIRFCVCCYVLCYIPLKSFSSTASASLPAYQTHWASPSQHSRVIHTWEQFTRLGTSGFTSFLFLFSLCCHQSLMWLLITKNRLIPFLGLNHIQGRKLCAEIQGQC